MSIRQGNNIISSGNNKVFPLLHHDWFDYILNDLNWLRADTFTPYSGTIYKPVYNHLVADFDGTVATSETISGITITYYRATDGHKICLPDQEVNLTNLYNTIGIAWYYVLDIPNQTFKLPRSKYNTVTSIITNPGDYVEPSLPNIAGDTTLSGGTGLFRNDASVNGVFYKGTQRNTGFTGANVTSYDIGFDASRSSPIYKNNATVQPPAVQKYLYFYIGNFTQNAIDTIANLNMEILNAKVNTGHEVIAFQAPDPNNNYRWYRKYKDGWIEQGGVEPQPTTDTVGTTVTLPQVMANDKYVIQFSNYNPTTGTGAAACVQDNALSSITATSFTFARAYNGPKRWLIMGLAA